MSKSNRFKEMAKYEKVRKSQKKSGGTIDLQDEFVIDESRWPKHRAAEGDAPPQESEDSEPAGFTARVVEVHKRYAFVSKEPRVGEIDTSDVWLATIARRFLLANRHERNFVSVGDRVFCTKATEQDVKSDLPACAIQMMAPRSAKISRLDPHTPEREHVLAANMDQLLIVASYKHPKIKWGLIDRYLVIAEREEVSPIIVINKKDLRNSGRESFKDDCDLKEKTYREIGYTVLRTEASSDDALSDSDVKKLKELLSAKITLLSGHSGVGKSSLVNLFAPEIVQAVELDPNIFYKGRHTTSYASFIKLGVGGFVIDSPGVRSFTFEEMTSIDLSYCFREFRPFNGQCKFRECRHIDEPDCAILDAVKSGKIQPFRLASYHSILLGASGREGRIREITI